MGVGRAGVVIELGLPKVAQKIERKEMWSWKSPVLF